MFGLHTDDRIIQIINNLNVVSQLKPGSTLSTSTMTIVDHTAWSGSVWRTYAGENRNQTIACIKRVFLEALTILKINNQEESNSYRDVKIGLETGILGLLSLKETYKGDYYLIGEIDTIIESTNKELLQLCSKKELSLNNSLNSSKKPNSSLQKRTVVIPVDDGLQKEHLIISVDQGLQKESVILPVDQNLS